MLADHELATLELGDEVEIVRDDGADEAADLDELGKRKSTGSIRWSG